MVRNTNRPNVTSKSRNRQESFFMEVMCSPFFILRSPVMKIQAPNLSWRPSSSTVFVLIFLYYFLIVSGVIYDIVLKPSSTGNFYDRKTDSVRPIAILQNKINSQYIIEGLAGGFLFSLGGVGFILIEHAQSPASSAAADRGRRALMLVAGVVCVGVAVHLCQLFIRVKIPAYLLSSA